MYFVIMNGVRYTGMPAREGEHTPEETWKPVSFIRRVPRLTPEDLEKVTAEEIRATRGTPTSTHPDG